MTQFANPYRSFTVEDYLSREREASVRHEFRYGQIVAMAGGSVRHSRIIANAIRALGNRLSGGPCAPFDSNLRVRIAKDGLYSYPDVTVICGPVETDPQDRSGETVTNPRLVLEVLSPSTEKDDLSWKFDGYREMETFREYVVVDQQSPRVQIFFRQPDWTWAFDVAVGLDAVARLRSVDAALPLSEVYAGVEFPPAPVRPGSADEPG